MKIIKFNHDYALLIEQGKRHTTWRLFDDKDLAVNDEFQILDKVSSDTDSWRIVGLGKIKEIVEKKIGDVTAADLASHIKFASRQEMLATFREYYGAKVDWDTPVKIITFDFIPKEEKISSAAVLLDEAKLYTDGGSRGNPGDSACAYAICKMDGTVVEKSGFYLGMATNNQAEYMGFKKGLQRAGNLGIKRITLFSDSQLVVNQMNGIYKVKNRELAPLHDDVKQLATTFQQISFNYVPRELNKVADGEVNRILDEHERSK